MAMQTMLHVHHLLTLTIILTLALTINSNTSNPTTSPTTLPTEPIPTAWPDRFHMLLVMNATATSNVSVADLWYDWPGGLNVFHIQYQYEDLIYNVLWNNGTQFYYTRGHNDDGDGFCNLNQYEVGIPRRDWMQGGVYEGQTYVDGFLCNVWNKVDFTWYYEEVGTKRPIMYRFFDGFTVHVVTFEVGVVPEHSKWQAPSYCFDKHVDRKINSPADGSKIMRSLMAFE